MIRQKLVLLATYSVYPATYGGPVRVVNLLRHLSKWYDITVLSYDCHAKSASRQMLGPGFEARTFPAGDGDMRHLLHLMEQSRGLFFHDILCASDYSFSQDFLKSVKETVLTADIIVVEQPYFMPLVEQVRSRHQIVVNGSQNCEFDLKVKSYAPGNAEVSSRFLRMVHDVEASSFALSDLDICVSEEDRLRLSSEYGVPANSIHLVPNCTDCALLYPATSEERQRNKAALGLEGRPVGIFLGSGYAPNIISLRAITSALRNFRRDFVLLVVGSIGDHVQQEEFRSLTNCVFVGYVGDAEKRTLLATADVALHMITEGSGTNLKLFDYMAAGLPIIANPLGARGGPGAEKVFVHAEDGEALPAVLQNLLNDPAARDMHGAAARRVAVEQFDWAVAARTFHGLLRGGVTV